MIIHCDTTRFIYEVLEQGEYSFVFDHLRIIDLGCNIGTFSMWIYPHAERIWAVDCEQNHIDNFNKTIRENGLQGITTIADRVLDLAAFMNSNAINKVDLLKIDIEGDEYEIIKKENFPVFPVIIGEYHRYSLDKLLTDKGYRYIDLPNKHFIARRI